MGSFQAQNYFSQNDHVSVIRHLAIVLPCGAHVFIASRFALF